MEFAAALAVPAARLVAVELATEPVLVMVVVVPLDPVTAAASRPAVTVSGERVMSPSVRVYGNVPVAMEKALPPNDAVHMPVVVPRREQSTVNVLGRERKGLV